MIYFDYYKHNVLVVLIKRKSLLYQFPLRTLLDTFKVITDGMRHIHRVTHHALYLLFLHSFILSYPITHLLVKS